MADTLPAMLFCTAVIRSLCDDHALRRHLAVIIEATLRGFKFRIIAAFLLDQEILRAAGLFRRGQEGLPRHGAFAEQDLVAFFLVG